MSSGTRLRGYDWVLNLRASGQREANEALKRHEGKDRYKRRELRHLRAGTPTPQTDFAYFRHR